MDGLASKSSNNVGNDRTEAFIVQVENTIRYPGGPLDLNVAAAMECVDACAGRVDMSKTLLRTCASKFKEGCDPEAIHRSLELVEMCVKNTGLEFAKNIDESFMRAMTKILKITTFKKSFSRDVKDKINKLIGTSTNPGVATDPRIHKLKRKVLFLIQLWHDSFLTHQGSLAPLYNAYKKLRINGVEFPSIDPSLRFLVRNAEVTIRSLSFLKNAKVVAWMESPVFDPALREASNTASICKDSNVVQVRQALQLLKHSDLPRARRDSCLRLLGNKRDVISTLARKYASTDLSAPGQLQCLSVLLDLSDQIDEAVKPEQLQRVNRSNIRSQGDQGVRTSASNARTVVCLNNIPSQSPHMTQSKIQPELSNNKNNTPNIMPNDDLIGLVFEPPPPPGQPIHLINKCGNNSATAQGGYFETLSLGSSKSTTAKSSKLKLQVQNLHKINLMEMESGQDRWCRGDAGSAVSGGAGGFGFFSEASVCPDIMQKPLHNGQQSTVPGKSVDTRDYQLALRPCNELGKIGFSICAEGQAEGEQDSLGLNTNACNRITWDATQNQSGYSLEGLFDTAGSPSLPQAHSAGDVCEQNDKQGCFSWDSFGDFCVAETSGKPSFEDIFERQHEQLATPGNTAPLVADAGFAEKAYNEDPFLDCDTSNQHLGSGFSENVEVPKISNAVILTEQFPSPDNRLYIHKNEFSAKDSFCPKLLNESGITLNESQNEFKINLSLIGNNKQQNDSTDRPKFPSDIPVHSAATSTDTGNSNEEATNYVGVTFANEWDDSECGERVAIKEKNKQDVDGGCCTLPECYAEINFHAVEEPSSMTAHCLPSGSPVFAANGDEKNNLFNGSQSSGLLKSKINKDGAEQFGADILKECHSITSQMDRIRRRQPGLPFSAEEEDNNSFEEIQAKLDDLSMNFSLAEF